MYGQAGSVLLCEQGADWIFRAPVDRPMIVALDSLMAERYATPAFPSMVAEHYTLSAASGTTAVEAPAPLPSYADWKREPRTEIKTVVDLNKAQTELAKLLIFRNFGIYLKWSAAGMLRTLYIPPWQELLRMTAPGVDALEIARACLRRDWRSLRGMGVGRTVWALSLAAYTMLFTWAFVALACTSLVIQLRRDRIAVALTWAVLCAYFLLLAGPLGHARYREQVAPALFPLAAYGLHAAVQAVRVRRRLSLDSPR